MAEKTQDPEEYVTVAEFIEPVFAQMAKGALENAVWDAEAEWRQIPLWRLLGGTQEEIACGVSIGIQDSVEQLLGKIETELGAGYTLQTWELRGSVLRALNPRSGLH